MYWSVCHLLTDRNGSCDFTQCGDGRCCCSTVIKPVWGETINVVVRRGGKRVASKDISIERSSKSTSLKFVIYHVSKRYTKPWSVNIKEIWWNTLDFFSVPPLWQSNPESQKSIQYNNPMWTFKSNGDQTWRLLKWWIITWKRWSRITKKETRRW